MTCKLVFKYDSISIKTIIIYSCYIQFRTCKVKNIMVKLGIKFEPNSVLRLRGVKVGNSQLQIVFALLDQKWMNAQIATGQKNFF